MEETDQTGCPMTDVIKIRGHTSPMAAVCLDMYVLCMNFCYFICGYYMAPCFLISKIDMEKQAIEIISKNS